MGHDNNQTDCSVKLLDQSSGVQGLTDLLMSVFQFIFFEMDANLLPEIYQITIPHSQSLVTRE